MSMTVNLALNEGLPERVHLAALHGLHDGAEIIKALSDAEVPVLSGLLIGSATIGADGDEVGVGYEAINNGYDYGIRQHEDMSLNHPNGGSAKFLETALHEGAEAALAATALRVAEALA